MAELKATKHEGDADDIAREHGMDALGEMLDEAVTIPPLGRHPSAERFVPKGENIQVATEEEWRELNGEYAAESEEPHGDDSEYMTPEEMGFGAFAAKQKAAAAEKLNRFKPIPWGSIEPDLEEEDLIDGLIPSSRLIVVFGPPSSGKSFFVSHLALHIAAGLSYAGRETKKARVIYIAAEGQEGFKKRVKAAREALGLKLTDDVWFSLIPVTPNLGTGNEDVTALIEAIKAEGGPPPGLIVVDTLSRSLCGADENGPGMATFVENCGKLSEAFNGVPVMPVLHTGWSEGRTRGWSGLHGATDAELSIVNKDGVRHVSIGKMKDGEDSLGWTFQLNQVEVGTNPKSGKVKTSCIVELLSKPAPVERKAEAGDASTLKKGPPRSLLDFNDAFNEAKILHGKIISCTYSGVLSEMVSAVDLQLVRKEFSKRRAVVPDNEDGDTAKEHKRKRDKAISAAFNGILKNLPKQYRTELQGEIQYIWKPE